MSSAAVDVDATVRPLRLAVGGGGTGGHTYPALTTIRALQARLASVGRELEVLWVGTADSLEARVAAGEGIRFEAVSTGKVRRSSNPLKMLSPTNVADMGRASRGVMQARGILSRFAPDVVLTTGGFVAIPVGMAARLCHRPLVADEQTARLGLANKVLVRAGGARMAVSSPATLDLLPEEVRRETVVTGNPVRPEILCGRPEKAIEALSLAAADRSLPTVYVTGGAQGAVQINTLVGELLPWLLSRANVVHQCGPANLEVLRHAGVGQHSGPGRYVLVGYVGAELPDVLALADVVISRSGAGTIAELTALGKASVLVPYASAAGAEQAHNARYLSEQGAAVALLDDEVTPQGLHAALAPLLDDAGRRDALAAKARQHGQPDAADRLVDVVFDAAGISH